MKRSILLLVLFSAVFLPGLLTCSKNTYNARDIVAAKAHLDTLYQDWCHAWCGHDLDGYLVPIDEDAVFLGWPEETILAGKPLIAQSARQRFSRGERGAMHPTYNRDTWLLHVTPCAAWAEVGITISFATASGMHNQHFLESIVFRKIDGTWKIVQYQRSNVTQKARS